ncbi:MAG: hypothetical protein OFPII_30010 [Osedax symbiont Rs1]|nr:MAG: hypothetical protein OFPII_30010 [Osedax symbiont Rs1]
MKKIFRNMSMLIALGLVSTTAFADYNGCRKAGGGFWGCAYGAAMNDRIAAPIEDKECTGSTAQCSSVKGKYSKIQLKKIFEKNKDKCGLLPVDKQMACLFNGSSPLNKKVVKIKSSHLPLAGMVKKS